MFGAPGGLLCGEFLRGKYYKLITYFINLLPRNFLALFGYFLSRTHFTLSLRPSFWSSNYYSGARIPSMWASPLAAFVCFTFPDIFPFSYYILLYLSFSSQPLLLGCGPRLLPPVQGGEIRGACQHGLGRRASEKRHCLCCYLCLSPK